MNFILLLQLDCVVQDITVMLDQLSQSHLMLTQLLISLPYQVVMGCNASRHFLQSLLASVLWVTTALKGLHFLFPAQMEHFHQPQCL